MIYPQLVMNITNRMRIPPAGVDFLNHSWEPNASSDWDEARHGEAGGEQLTHSRFWRRCLGVEEIGYHPTERNLWCSYKVSQLLKARVFHCELSPCRNRVQSLLQPPEIWNKAAALCGTWMARRLDSRWRGEPALSDWMNLSKRRILTQVKRSWSAMVTFPIPCCSGRMALPCHRGQGPRSPRICPSKRPDLKNEDVCPRFVPDFLAFSMVFPECSGIFHGFPRFSGIFRRFSQLFSCAWWAFSKLGAKPAGAVPSLRRRAACQVTAGIFPWWERVSPR